MDMTLNAPNEPAALPRPMRLLHLALIIGAACALISSDWAEDYKNASHLGFTVHMWCGIFTAAVLLTRILYGLLGPESARFSTWVPVTREQWQWIVDDVRGVLRGRIPDRPLHGGLAGAVQAAGLLVFAVMAFTGTMMAMYLDPGQKAAGLIKLIKEVHEATSNLVYLYLMLHVGAVVLHSAVGRPIWPRMFPRRGS